MKTVILCGGMGTRIRDVADNIPKPMIPIGRYPILWHIMKYYATGGFDEFVLCLGYKGDAIRDFFINYRQFTSDCTVYLSGRIQPRYHDGNADRWVVTLAETGLQANTGARVARVRKYVDMDDHFMLTYGDGVGNVDLVALVKFHKAHGRILTVTGVRPPGRFGEISCDRKGKVIEFNEKPQVTGGRISGGFIVCRRKIFEYLEPREDLDFEAEVMRELAADGEMMMFPHDGFWMPMDTSREYNLLNTLYSQGKAPWVVW